MSEQTWYSPEGMNVVGRLQRCLTRRPARKLLKIQERRYPSTEGRINELLVPCVPLAEPLLLMLSSLRTW